MAGQGAHELPIFELPLVLLPGEQTALHIFEDRYKRMIGQSIEDAEPFGVVFRDDDGARAVGCTARIDEVLEQFEDGRLNVLVSGETPFKVLDRFEATEFPVGEVELIGGEAPGSDAEAAERARETFAELAERATGARPEPVELSDAGSYEIAGQVELPDETKQRLLELRDEDERLRLLGGALEAVGEALEQAEDVADRASSNGRVTHS